ncbi:hypothetical protein TSOC_005047 [Tetrabaena socialis]|uniref:Thioredoxin-dependent peroxiredoxin Q n=1 Tax=Tetrabaena socialis TaxID=47790 RepID=A0A2J8A7H2_9CHLO|nr:hypothetical protein TSOC_005047 [Tetrabaena socialis]|eukprot:PNH08468.1 hypothetical protein TSOC_005047 [Tetrabaena socialis]
MAAGGFSPSSSGIDPASYPAPYAAPNNCNYDPNSRTRRASGGCTLACTRGCTLQANAFKDNIAAFTSRGYQVYGMSADPPAAQAGWKAEHGLPYLLLSDTTKSALSALGALGPNGKITRSHFVFAEGGKVEDAQIGIGSADSLPVALAFVTSKK